MVSQRSTQDIGLGCMLRKAKGFNNTLLAKLGWMIASKRDSLCFKLLRAKIQNYAWFHKDPPKSLGWVACLENTNLDSELGSYFKQNDLPFESFWAFLLF